MVRAYEGHDRLLPEHMVEVLLGDRNAVRLHGTFEPGRAIHHRSLTNHLFIPHGDLRYTHTAAILSWVYSQQANELRKAHPNALKRLNMYRDARRFWEK